MGQNLNRCLGLAALGASLMNPAIEASGQSGGNFTPLPIEDVIGEPEPIGPSSRITGLIISEIMYHPAAREDQRNLEYIEIFNSEDWSLDLSGFRISGDVDYTFAQGTTIPARGYLVVAANPADVEAVYGISGVFGPWEGSLPNDSGTVRLRHRIGAIYQEVEYRDEAPWPVGADGTGHSIVLARPSYGERDPQSWSRGDQIGGSPGAAEPAGANPYKTVLINEFLAHTDDPVVDYVELYNYSEDAVDLSGCILSDDPDLDKFFIPDSTSIEPGGFVVFDQNQLGFALDSSGERILLKSADGTRVIDAVKFGGQENGVATGRYPDGAPSFQRLSEPTPGSANAPPLIHDIVINEIMFNPITRDDNEEYLELYNKGTGAVDISGWRLRDDIRFTFPENTVIEADDYLVVAKDAVRLIGNYDNLNAGNTLGDYNGVLSNSSGRILLQMPDEVINVTPTGQETETIWITIDELTYKEGGRWAQWADGDGSSLELIDPYSDNRLASNWAGSDESEKSDWTTISHTGVLDNGQGAINELHVMLLGAGEALVDDINVSRQGQSNQLPNPNFNNGFNNWIAQGNHVFSGVSANGQGFGGGRAMHLVATGGGDNGANRVESDLNTTFSSGQTATISARVRWLKGNPHVLLRLHGNHLELSARMEVPKNLGTPGAPNSRRVANAGPSVYSVTHEPAVPAANQDVLVTARVNDPDGVSSVALKYRIDPSMSYTTVNMDYQGAGMYSAVLPGQSTGELAAFFVEATDANDSPATATFPDEPDEGECLVRFGDRRVSARGNFGTYRVWVTSANLDEWEDRVRLSNQLLDTTFVYGDFRPVYNAGGRYRGSAFIRVGYPSPASSGTTALVFEFPKDNLVLGADKINLDGLEQPGRDDTLQREKISFWIGEQLGVSFSYQRYVHLYFNGTKKGQVYTDSHQPDGEYVSDWHPDEDEGDLFKLDDWFEFNDDVLREFNVDADLRPYTTTGGEYKQARYRWTWEKKPNKGLDDDYSRLFELVDAVNTPGDEAYTAAVESLADVEQWMRVFATRHIVADWDGYGYDRGKNQSGYKPDNGKWKMFLWDLDFSLGGGSRSATDSMFSVNDSTIARMYNHPPFRRAYFRAMQDAVEGPLLAANSSPVMDAIYSAFRNNSVFPSSPDDIKSWINTRRNYLIGLLEDVESDFNITSNGGNDFSTDESLVELTGTAPIRVKTIQVNGVEFPVTWTGVNDWRLQAPLGPGENLLTLEAYDLRGNLIPGLSDTIEVTFTGEVQRPEDFIVINEIMYYSSVPDTDFLELYNASTTHAFDLSGYVLNGAGFVFPDGVLIQPGDYLIVAENSAALFAEYGATIPVAGEFGGNLDNGGETLSLIELGAAPEEDILIDEVTYEDDPPWPALADGMGSSLQLIDPVRDNRRVANWGALETAPGSGEFTSLLPMTATWKYEQSGTDLGTAWRAPDYNDSSWPSGAALLYVENSDLPAPKNTELELGEITYYFRTHFNIESTAGVALNAQIVLDDGAILYLNGSEWRRVGMDPGPVDHDTFAGRVVDNAQMETLLDLPTDDLLPGDNVIAVEVHQWDSGSSDIVFGLSLESTVEGAKAATPGEANSTRSNLAAFPLVFLNEVQPENLSGPRDGQGERDPWVELYNAGAETVSLNDYFLSNDYADPQMWAFPSGAAINPGQFLVVWLDGEPGESMGFEYHADFTIPPDTGSVLLTRGSGEDELLVDYLNYRFLSADRSHGAFPDGKPNKRQDFLIPTAGDANDDSAPSISVFINEWMASNTSTISDPADNNFEDWLELYNAGSGDVDLSGYYLTDNLTDWNQFELPPGTVIPANGYLLVWADNDPDQNGAGNGVHADFQLSMLGEEIGLFAPNGAEVDSLSFAEQTEDVSEGRWPDGNAEPFIKMNTPTPGDSNINDNGGGNEPPVLAAIGAQVVNEGELLNFTAGANDPDEPAQTLTFSLDEGAPAGASIDPASGVFSWTPGEADGPGEYPVTVRVTDDGSPALSDFESITIVVNEVNAAPGLTGIEDQSVDEGAPLNFMVAASDDDIPIQSLSFSLGEGAPAGAGIHATTGEFTWTPGEEHGGDVYPITVIVTDSGNPAQAAMQTFEVTVNETNLSPQLTFIGQQTAEEGELLTFTVSATDADLPEQTLTFGLDAEAPAGAEIDPNTGVFSWTPTVDQDPGIYPITVTVTDNGDPAKSDSETFNVVVGEIPEEGAITGIELDLDGVTITFAAQEGNTYILQYKDDLSDSEWIDADEVTATGFTASLSDAPGGQQQRFYRISLVIQ